MRQVLYEIKRVIVGQDLMLERILVALLARGHVLIEGVPGLAKTLAIKTTARVIDCQFKRIQFTPDLVPADLIGTRIYNQHTGKFDVEQGPVFANLVLADEINRAPAKVQSALLEAMQERQVTIGKQTFPLPEPFLVLATQNPIESEGTYPLPEAQVDRFMFKVVITYPSYHEEMDVVERVTTSLPELAPVIHSNDLLAMQRLADAIYVDPKVMDYAVTLATATRRPGEFGLPEMAKYIAYGASPRASVNMILGAKAMAVMETPAKVLRRLEFKVIRRLDGFLFGDYRGIFYGPSLDLAEVREYQPGDEIKRIDWNVTARMNRLFIRQYLEERELTAWLLVDLSPSMAFGTRRRLKRELAIEFAGVASYIIARHGDKVGVMTFPGAEVPIIPPRAGRRHTLRLLHTLQRGDAAGHGPTDLTATLHAAAGVFKRRHLVFVVSDFIAPAGWETPLRELGRRH